MQLPWKGLKLVLALTVAASIAAASPVAAQFLDVTAAAGLTTGGQSTGAAWADYDGDGCVDLFVTGHTTNRLYHNNCNGTFTDVAAAMGITGPTFTRGVAWGDYDGDEDLDLYLASEFSPNALYRNNGGSFTNVAAAAGVDDIRGSYGVSWADFDADGDLDLFVANRFAVPATDDKTDRLYRNEGNGTFVDVGPASGVGTDSTRNTFMGVWFDYDNNGTTDLYLSVDFGDDILFSNNGNGTFSDVSVAAGVADPQHGMGLAVGDPNRDGCFEVASTNNTIGADAEHDATVLYSNRCDGTFTNASAFAGVLDREVVEWGINFVDIDNDQDEDLSIVAGGMLTSGQPNVIYGNSGGGIFHDITTESGTANNGAAFASVWADYDGDGDLDWFVANETGSNVLFQNQTVGRNHLKVRLHGVVSNTFGIGARVDIPVPGQPTKTSARLIQAGQSYLGAHEPVAFFGVGATTTIDALTVLWPSGVIDALSNVAVNQVLEVTEGEAIVNGGRFEGIITDPSGAPVSRARVAARHRTTGQLFKVQSGPDGSYVIQGLLPGSYSLRASKPGFLGSLQGGATLHVDETIQVNLQLRL